MGKVPLIKVNGAQNHHLYKRGNVFWVRIYKAEKGRLEESLKTEILGEARILRDKRVAEFLGTRPRFAGKAFLVDDKFPEFIELKKGKSKGTYDSIVNQWQHHLKDYFGGLLLDEVTETEWLKYVNKKRETHPDRKFFNDRKYLSMFLHWLHREGLIDKLPKLPDVDPELDAGKVYSNDEIKALLSNSAGDLHLQILMALTMGMRKGEILSLEWSQIDFKKATIHLPAHKTKIRKARTFGVPPKLLNELSARRLVIESKWVFPSPIDPAKSLGPTGNKKSWATCKRLAGVTGRFHDLRHSFLTHAFKKSVNPALICEYAGVSLEEAQKTYLHFSVEDTRIVGTLFEVPT